MLTPQQLETLRAVMDRLIPPDEAPGAWDAGVGAYLERQFDRDLKHYVQIYQDGLGAIDEEAFARHGQPFVALPTDQQDALLQAVEAGQTVVTWRTPPRPFMAAFICHVAEGYYADPGNGGNREAKSWQMIGFRVTDGPMPEHEV